MFWKKGWVLNSLKYQVEKNLRETIYANQFFLNERWNLLEKQILHVSKHPIRSVLLTSIAFSLIAVDIVYWEPYFKDHLKWNASTEWQMTLLTGQLTLLGVVYPLVIGIIGFLLQDKPAATATWSLYSKYSGFLFTSLSGIALAIFILIIRSLAPALSLSVSTAFSAVSFGWLVINLILTAWFFWSTFKFVNEKSRVNLLFRYSINDSFIEDIRERLSYHLPSAATERGLIKVYPKEVCEVSTLPPWGDNHESMVRKFDKEMKVGNIYFRIVNLAIGFWLGKKSSNIHVPKLSLPLNGEDSAIEWTIATYANTNPPLLSRALLRLAYRPTRPHSPSKESLNDVLSALIGTTEAALQKSDLKSFEDCVKNLKEWNAQTLDMLAFRNDEGFIDNWILLPSARLFGRRYIDQILREYYRLSVAAIKKLEDDKEFFGEIIHLHQGILNRLTQPCPTMTSNEYVNGHHLIWSALADWHIQKDQRIELEVNPLYEKVLAEYVGSWESWPTSFEPRSKRWKESASSIDQFSNHLKLTAQMVVISIRKKDRISAEWAIDVLNYWHRNLTQSFHDPNMYVWNTELLTHTVIGKELNEPIWKHILQGGEFNLESAVSLSLGNSWTDIRIITCCYLLSRFDESSPKWIFELAMGIIEGKRFRPSDYTDSIDGSIDSPEDILTAYIRHRWYWEHGESTYSSWIDSIIDSFSQLEERNWVSGRVYSGRGMNDTRSQIRSYVSLAVRLSNSEWRLSSQWENLLYSELVTHEHRTRLVEELKTWITFIDDEHLGEDNNSDEERNRAENCKASILAAIKRITERDQQQILDAPIDPEVLDRYSDAASRTAFKKNSNSLPYFLFKEISYDCPKQKEFMRTISILDYQKANVAKGIEVRRAANEDDWLDNSFSDRVRVNIFQDFFRHIKESIVEVNLPNLNSMLERIRSDAAIQTKHGIRPIILTGSFYFSRVLRRSLYDPDKASTLNVDKREGFGDSYIAHLEGVPVYLMRGWNMDYTLLVDTEIFVKLSFHRSAEGKFVECEFKVAKPHDPIGTLSMSYWKKSDFVDKEVTKYTFDENNEESIH